MVFAVIPSFCIQFVVSPPIMAQYHIAGLLAILAVIIRGTSGSFEFGDLEVDEVTAPIPESFEPHETVSITWVFGGIENVAEFSETRGTGSGLTRGSGMIRLQGRNSSSFIEIDRVEEPLGVYEKGRLCDEVLPAAVTMFLSVSSMDVTKLTKMYYNGRREYTDCFCRAKLMVQMGFMNLNGVRMGSWNDVHGICATRPDYLEGTQGSTDGRPPRLPEMTPYGVHVIKKMAKAYKFTRIE